MLDCTGNRGRNCGKQYYQPGNSSRSPRGPDVLRLDRMEAGLKLLEASSTRTQQAVERLEKCQSIALANVQAPVPDFDMMMKTHLQPVTTVLDNIQKQTALPSSMIDKVVAERVTRTTSTITHEDLGQEGAAAVPTPGRTASKQVADYLRTERDESMQRQKEELRDLQTAIERFIREEFAKQQEVVKQQLEVYQTMFEDNLRRQEAAGKDEVVLNTPVEPVKEQDISAAELKPHLTRPLSFEEAAIARGHASSEDFGKRAHAIELQESASFAAVFIHDNDVATPIYHVEEFYKDTGWPQAVARSYEFGAATVVVVCMNAVFIGIEADWNTEANLYDSDPIFIFFNTFFLIYFLIEWIVRLLAFRDKRDSMKDGWMRFDGVLLIMMVLDTWVIMVVLKLMENSGKMRVPTAPFRLIRLLKLTRMARLMKAFPELITMIQGLVRSLRAIASTCILLVLITYIWGIIMHMILHDEDALNARIARQAEGMDFRTVPHAMWTLFIDGTMLLDNAGLLMTELVFYHNPGPVFAGILLVLFVLLSAILLLQMLIGVLCDLVAGVNQEQRDAFAIGLVKQELALMLIDAADEDGNITQDYLLKIINTGNAKAVFKELGINQLFLFQLQEMLFIKAQSVKVRTILELMVLCRSKNPATVETLAGGFCFIAMEVNSLRKHVHQIIEQAVKPSPRGTSPLLIKKSPQPRCDLLLSLPGRV